MEPALLVGENIIVNKMSFGARLFNPFVSSEEENLLIYRLPGIGKIEKNDVLVFNFPYKKYKNRITFSLEEYYIKRCIGLPGDIVEIRDFYYWVNGIPNIYSTKFQKDLSHMKEEEWTKKVVNPICYPVKSDFDWTVKEFGPFYIPKKGDKIDLTFENIVLYKSVIEWEQKNRLSIVGNKIYLGDQLLKEYKFRENYYFMGGDKIENSFDSRYWGLLPEEFILGKAFWIWKSIDGDICSEKEKRFMKRIK